MDSKRKTLIVCASVATIGTASFAIYQLARVLFSVVRESEIEATKLLASVTAQIQSDNPDVEIPDELQLEDDMEEIYSYGNLQELFYRRHIGGDTDWQWSFDREDWFSTGDLAPVEAHILDPPSLFFVTRLHLISVARRKAVAAEDAAGSSSSSKSVPRIPPPVELPPWAQQQQQQQPAVADSMQEPQIDHVHDDSSSSKDSSGAANGQQTSSDSNSSSRSNSSNKERRTLEDAPELLCCPITGQIMVQPVTLPSGKTFEYEAIRKWITRHGTDPTTGLTPVSIHDIHPNLIVREMVEKWLAGVDPLADHIDNPAAAAAADEGASDNRYPAAAGTAAQG